MAGIPAGGVFISYRRGDDSPVAGLLRDCLEEEFGRADLLADAYEMPASPNFIPVIEQRMMECSALLVVISELWLDAPDGSGGRLLDNPDDFVRVEIASALRQNKRILPVLVNEARMPGVERLPEALKPLVYCNTVRLSHKRAMTDLEQLAATLRTVLAEAEGAVGRAARGETEWRAATQRANFEQVTAWPTLAEFHEVLEPANWETIKAQQNARPARSHLDGVSGLFPPDPATQVEIASWRAFLSEFPDDIDVDEGREGLQALEREAEAALQAEASEFTEAEAWMQATRSGSIEEILAFLNEWPAGEHAAEAREWLRAVELAAKAAWAAEARKADEAKAWTRATSSGSIAEIKHFLTEWPAGEHAEVARTRLRTLESEAATAWAAKAAKHNEANAWASVADSGSTEGIKAFLNEWPSGEHSEEALARINELREPVVSRRDVIMKLGIGAVAVVGGFIYAARTRSGKLPPSLNDRPIRTYMGHAAWVHSVAFSPDGRTVLSGDSKSLILWDVAKGKTLRSFKGGKDDIRSAAFSPDGNTVLSGDGGGELKLWDVATGEALRSVGKHNDGVPSVAFSPDGRTALSASFDGTLKLSDLATGRELRTFKGHTGDVNSVAFSPDGRNALSGSRDRTVRLWDVATGKEIRIFAGHADWVSSAVFSPDGRTILSSSTDKTLKLWDVATGRELRAFPGHARDFGPVAFSPDGRTILSGGFPTLKLWDVATGQELRTFAGHADGVTAVVISPDGGMAISGSVDTTLKLWDLTPNAKSQ